MPYTTIFFDLDDTLYPSTTGLWNAIRDRMNQYLWERLDLPREEVPRIRRQYFETYGTTLRGLQRHHDVDAEDYLAFVHDLPLKDYLAGTPRLRDMLLGIPLKRWIFTNADSDHARRVLAELELSACFEGIIDVRRTEFFCKPEEEAYRRALGIAGEADPRQCILIDDSARNLSTATRMGFFTILVGAGDYEPTSGNQPPCLRLPSVTDLKNALADAGIIPAGPGEAGL